MNTEQELGASSIFLDMLPTLFTGLTVAAILGIGGLRVIEGSLTLGGLVAFQSLMASFSGPVTELVNYVGSLQTIKGLSAWRTSTIILSEIQKITPSRRSASPQN